MTGYEVFERAMMLLGYSDADGNIQDGNGLSARALETVNQIGLDLCGMTQAESLFDQLELDEKSQDAMIYGVGMILSLSNGDSNKHRLFCELYQGKRSAAKASLAERRDTLMRGFGG